MCWKAKAMDYILFIELSKKTKVRQKTAAKNGYFRANILKDIKVNIKRIVTPFTVPKPNVTISLTYGLEIDTFDLTFNVYRAF